MSLPTIRHGLQLVARPASAPARQPASTTGEGEPVPRTAPQDVLRHTLELEVAHLTQVNRALEGAVAEQTDELRRWHQAMIDAELRLLELKQEVNDALAQFGQPPRYASVADGGNR